MQYQAAVGKYAHTRLLKSIQIYILTLTQTHYISLLVVFGLKFDFKKRCMNPLKIIKLHHA